jgi:hypothetical protein
MAVGAPTPLPSPGSFAVNRLKEKADFKRKLHQAIAEFERQAGGTAPRDYPRAQTADPLEHVTRRHLIDHMLSALGWDIHRMSLEMIEEARTRGETTLFIDYLGINPRTRVPRMIFEAKAWAKPFVKASPIGAEQQGQRNTSSDSALLAAAIQHCKSGAPRQRSPVTAEWTDWISALRDYVVTIHAESGHVVSRVAISTGQWLVVFTDPEVVFIRPGEVPVGAIRVFIGSQLIESSDEIFELLDRTNLINDIPLYVSPSRLPAFTSAADIAHVFRALWITRHAQGAHFRIRPQLIVNAALVIARRDGAILTVLDDQLQESVVPHVYEELPQHIADVTELADRLLEGTIREIEHPLIPSPASEFPGFDQAALQGDALDPTQPVTLVKPWQPRPDEFLLVLGVDAHFLRLQPEVGPCAFHEWAACHAHQQSQGPTAIMSRSVDPAAFFFSGELHHCAHRLIHDRRRERCQIRPFEQFLCCRACSLQSFCWNVADLARLPCPATQAIVTQAVHHATADVHGSWEYPARLDTTQLAPYGDNIRTVRQAGDTMRP